MEDIVFLDLLYIGGKWMVLGQSLHPSWPSAQKELELEARSLRILRARIRQVGEEVSPMKTCPAYQHLERAANGLFVHINTCGIIRGRVWVVLRLKDWREIREKMQWLPSASVPLPQQFLQPELPMGEEQSSSVPSSNTMSVGL